MKTVRISEDVWGEIAKRGQFGESVDDVLRRVFGIVEPKIIRREKAGKRQNFATNKMSSCVERNKLIVEFATGERKEWPLPDRSDRKGIRKVRTEAGAFAEQCGATIGQVNAVYKALTEDGYHVSR